MTFDRIYRIDRICRIGSYTVDPVYPASEKVLKVRIVSGISLFDAIVNRSQDGKLGYD